MGWILWFLFLLFVGVIVDCIDCWKLIVCVDMLCVFIVGVILIFVFSNSGPGVIWILVGFVFLLGFVEVLCDNVI